jgi:chitinase
MPGRIASAAAIALAVGRSGSTGPRRRGYALPALLFSALALAGGATASGADFTASSASPTTFTAAADFNTVAVSLADPGTNLQGTVTLSATASSNRGIGSVLIQAAPAGTTSWTDVCTDASAPYSCPWDTVAAGDGSYDLRAAATDSAGYSRTATRSARVVDNVAPAVSLTDPGAALSGTKTITATASDAGSGLQSITIRHRAAGATTWTDLCTGATSPRSCSLDTTSLPDGNRELQAVATDRAGRSRQTVTTTVRIDNTAPTATPSVPPTGRGTVTLTATAGDSGSGVAYVAFEGFYANTWYEFCRDTSAPYTCSGDSTPIADGTYSVRAVVVDNAGVKTTSASSQITIDNTAPTAADVQATNGGATPGGLEAGDAVTLTWSEPIAPASVLAGWSGASQAIRVQVTNAAANDQLDFYDGTGTTRLGLVATAADLKLGADVVTADAEFDATMARSGNAITITLGSLRSGTLTTATAGTMTWRPSTAATDLFGNPSSTALRTETGAADVDF